METKIKTNPTPPVWAKPAKKIMRKKKILQKDLVGVFGVNSDSSVGHYFRGRRKASAEQVANLAGYIGVSIDDLMAKTYEFDSTTSLNIGGTSDVEYVPARDVITPDEQQKTKLNPDVQRAISFLSNPPEGMEEISRSFARTIALMPNIPVATKNSKNLPFVGKKGDYDLKSDK